MNIGNGKITENQKIMGDFGFNIGTFLKENTH